MRIGSDMEADTYAAFLVLNNKLNRILNILGDEVMPALDDLEAEVARLEAAADAVVARIEQLIVQGMVDPARVQAAVDRLKAVGGKLETAAIQSGEPSA
jgi:hypothetical protein